MWQSGGGGVGGGDTEGQIHAVKISEVFLHCSQNEIEMNVSKNNNN